MYVYLTLSYGSDITSSDPNVLSGRENDQSLGTESAEVSPNRENGIPSTQEGIGLGDSNQGANNESAKSSVEKSQTRKTYLKKNRNPPNWLNLCIHS